jgi:hypothetical protein
MAGEWVVEIVFVDCRVSDLGRIGLGPAVDVEGKLLVFRR